MYVYKFKIGIKSDLQKYYNYVEYSKVFTVFTYAKSNNMKEIISQNRYDPYLGHVSLNFRNRRQVANYETLLVKQKYLTCIN